MEEDELSNARDPCSLHGELEKLRRLVAESNSPGLTKSLIEAMAKLTKEIDRQDVLRSKYLHTDAVHRAVGEVLTVINEEMKVLPENVRNEIVDAIYSRIQLRTTNTAAEIKRIERK